MATAVLEFPLVVAAPGLPQVGLITVPLNLRPGQARAGTVTVHTEVGEPTVRVDHKEHTGCPGGTTLPVYALGLAESVNAGTLDGCPACLPA